MNFLKKLFCKKNAACGQATPAPEPKPAPEPPADHSEAIEHISAILSGLYHCLKAVLEEELEGFKSEADAFYASPESRDAEVSAAFGRAALNRRNEKAEEAGKAYIRAQGPEAMECYAKAQENFKGYSSGLPGGQSCYSRLAWGYLAPSELTQHEKRAIRDGDALALQRLEEQWHKAAAAALRKHWKPIRVLSGQYGQYDRCVCFDEEFGIFFALSPDDNYYHWGSYVMYPITRGDAESRVGYSLDDLPVASTPPCFKSYFREYETPEVRDRII